MNNAGDKSGNGKKKRVVSKRVMVVRIRSSSGRRETKKWSPEENQAVMDGVAKFGDGNWKLIFNHYYDILKHRSTTDIKDKYRLMTTRKPASAKEKEPGTGPNLSKGTRCSSSKPSGENGELLKWDGGKSQSLPLPAPAEKGIMISGVSTRSNSLTTSKICEPATIVQRPAEDSLAAAAAGVSQRRKGKEVMSAQRSNEKGPIANTGRPHSHAVINDAIVAARKATAAKDAGSSSSSEDAGSSSSSEGHKNVGAGFDSDQHDIIHSIVGIFKEYHKAFQDKIERECIDELFNADMLSEVNNLLKNQRQDLKNLLFKVYPC